MISLDLDRGQARRISTIGHDKVNLDEYSSSQVTLPCDYCQVVLSDTQSLHVHLGPPKTSFCHTCYAVIFAKELCKFCELPLSEKSITSRGEHWHTKCFRCATCGIDMSTDPQVDLSNVPKCGTCFEGSSGLEIFNDPKSCARLFPRSRSSLEIHKRSNRNGRPRGQSSTSFEDLMNKIKLNENHKPHKTEVQKRHSSSARFLKPSIVTATDRIPTDRGNERHIEVNTCAEPDSSEGLRSTAVQDSNTSDGRIDTGPTAIRETDDLDKRSSTMDTAHVLQNKFHGESQVIEQIITSDQLQKRLVPTVRTGPDLCRRRSTPRAWRVPSTQFEAEEDLEPSSVAANDISVVEEIVDTERRFNSAARSQHGSIVHKPLSNIAKSSSSGHLPGLFAQRPGRALKLNLGGTNRCAGCLKAVFPLEEVLGPASTKFHRACLRCAGCRKQMDSSSNLTTQVPESGSIHVYCRNCWDARFR